MKRSVKNHDSVEIDDEYGTPKEKYNAICKKLGMFPKLDVCGSEKNHVVNNYFTEELCDLSNNSLSVDLSLLFVVKPENTKEPIISLPIYIATIDSKDEIKNIQYFLVEGKLNSDEENKFIETEINNKISIKILNKDLTSGKKNKILIGFMLDNQKIEILN